MDMQKYGGVVTQRLFKELKGIPCIDIEDELVNKKMIATTRLSGRRFTRLDEIKKALVTYTSLVAERLRRQNFAASAIQIFAVTKDENHSAYFSQGDTMHAYSTLPVASSITNESIVPAMKLAEQIFQSGRKYKKAAVMLSGLVPDTFIHSNLFVPAKENNKRLLMSCTLDNINISMRNLIKFEASGIDTDWKMIREFRSPRYTSRWNESNKVN